MLGHLAVESILRQSSEGDPQPGQVLYVKQAYYRWKAASKIMNSDSEVQRLCVKICGDALQLLHKLKFEFARGYDRIARTAFRAL